MQQQYYTKDTGDSMEGLPRDPKPRENNGDSYMPMGQSRKYQSMAMLI